jgi:Caspase domain.
MKKSLFLLLCLLVLPLIVHSQTNRALFVVIENYNPDNGWRVLHSLNDYKLLKPLLVANKYAEQNIRLLKDQQATKAGIVSALNRLKQQTNAGDYVYIHFSGHGQQMADDNFDEKDGWDEAFIPYDAYYRYEPSYYEGKNHLRDDELEGYIDGIRLKAGPTGNVFVVMDACHSSTGTREEEDEFIRGTAFPFDKERYKIERNISKQKDKLTNNARMSPCTVFSACQATEANIEYPHTDGKHYGRLSFALHHVLSTKQAYTVNGLMNAIKLCFSNLPKNKQTPFTDTTNGNMTFKLGR